MVGAPVPEMPAETAVVAVRRTEAIVWKRIMAELGIKAKREKYQV